MLDKNVDFINHLAVLLEYIDENSTAENQKQIFNDLEKISLELKSQCKVFTPHQEIQKTEPIFEKGIILKPGFSNYLQNFEDDNINIWNQIGKGFSEKDAAFVNFSLNNLSALYNLQFMHFGKIKSFVGDYLVLLAAPCFNKKIYEKFESFDLKNAVQLADYLNTVKFFVTSACLNSNWVELKKIDAKHIRSSRNAKLLFTGKLTADLTEAGFAGTEEEYLHAQLLRIACATMVVPSGLFKELENEGNSETDLVKRVCFNEEAKNAKLSSEDLSSLENWVHLLPALLKNGGFFSFIESKGKSEEELAELKELVEQKDGIIESLADLSLDTGAQWKVRIIGSKGSLSNEEDLLRSQVVVLLENGSWEGSCSVYSFEQNRWSFFYCGFGLKKAQTKLQSKVGTPLTEPRIKVEQNEPNFVDEPVKEEESVLGEGEQSQEGNDDQENKED